MCVRPRACNFFLMQKGITQCRMSSVFLRNPEQRLIRKYKRPREKTFAGYTLWGTQTIRCSVTLLHL
jgi:hypothetical protein